MSASTVQHHDVLLETEGLRKWFPIKKGVFRKTVGHLRAVDDVSIRLYKGETLGLVGESGCGKSTLVQTLVRLLDPTEGRILTRFDGKEVDFAPLSRSELKPYRRFVQMVFQDPGGSMNPAFTVEEIVGEPMRIENVIGSAERKKRVAELLESVGLRAAHAGRYPEAFSGGQRQRIGIARSLALNPSLLILDEPVSALDVSVQSQILNLLKELKGQHGLTYLFIAHNLDVVRYMSDRIAVMYLGRIVEEGTRDEVYKKPKHPYTEMLLASIPIPSPKMRDENRKRPPSELPDPAKLPAGCDFAPRCRYATDRCRQERPELRTVEGTQQRAACHYAEELTLAGRGT